MSELKCMVDVFRQVGQQLRTSSALQWVYVCAQTVCGYVLNMELNAQHTTATALLHDALTEPFKATQLGAHMTVITVTTTEGTASVH
eukprot:12067-Heterococcus_DN1.PRE.3